MFEAIIIVWGVMYFATAIIAPDLLKSIGGKPLSGQVSQILMMILGTSALVSVALDWWWLYAILGAQEAFGAVGSYSGSTVWNVPGDQTLARLAMAMMDFIAAIAFFALMINSLP